MRNFICGTALFLAASGVASGQSVNQYLVYGIYTKDSAALAAYNFVKSMPASSGTTVRSYVVLSKDMNGRVLVQRKKGGDPTSSRIVEAAAHVASETSRTAPSHQTLDRETFLEGPTVGLPVPVVDKLRGSLDTGNSAIISVVDDRWAQEVQRRLDQPNQKAVVSIQLRPTVFR